jgi:hypothetical protein
MEIYKNKSSRPVVRNDLTVSCLYADESVRIARHCIQKSLFYLES